MGQQISVSSTVFQYACSTEKEQTLERLAAGEKSSDSANLIAQLHGDQYFRMEPTREPLVKAESLFRRVAGLRKAFDEDGIQPAAADLSLMLKDALALTFAADAIPVQHEYEQLERHLKAKVRGQPRLGSPQLTRSKFRSPFDRTTSITAPA